MVNSMKKVQQQISIPKCCQQPRSGRAKRRRVQFSNFICWSSYSRPLAEPPLSNHRHPGCTFEFSSDKDCSSNITTISMHHSNYALTYKRKRRRPRLSVDQLSVDEGGGNRGLMPFPEIESVAQNVLIGTFENGFKPIKARRGGFWRIPILRSTTIDSNEHVGDESAVGASPLTPEKSELRQIMKTDHVSIAPGSVVWARTAHHSWWPAEIMGERLKSSSSQIVDGHVLVQLYGSHEYAWIDPAAGDLAHFDDCFEIRSCNPVEAFQDALKQALHKKSRINLCGQGEKGPKEGSIPVQCDRSSVEGNTVSSSRRTGDDEVEGGKGKRKRKPKLHFDEVTFALKSMRKVRRLRIMRYLGLAAPPGSPFTHSSHARTVAYKSCRVLGV